MSSTLDLTLYTSLKKESFTKVEPTEVIIKEPRFFSYNKDIGLLLCSTCRFFLLSNTERTIRTHLRDLHPIYYNNTIKNKKDKKNTSIIPNLSTISNISINTLTNIPNNYYYFTALDLYFNTFVCKVCSFITINKDAFRKHVQSIHNRNIQGRNLDDNYLIANLPVQFIHEPRKFGAFIPKLPNLDIKNLVILSPTSKISNYTAESPSKVRDLIKGYNKTREALIKKNPFINTKYEQYPFITHFRFNDYLKNKDIASLLQDLDISYLKKIVGQNKLKIPLKNQDQLFKEFLYNRVPIIYEDIRPIISSLPSTIKQLIKNSVISLGTTNYLNREFKAISEESQKIYLQEYGNFLIYLINIYNQNLYNIEILDTEPILVPRVKELIAKLLTFNKINNPSPTASALREIDSIILDIFYEILATPITYSTLEKNPLFKNPLLTYAILKFIKPIDRTYNYRSSGFIANRANYLVYSSRLTTIARLRKLELENKDKNISYKLEDLYDIIYSETISPLSNKVYKEIFNIATATKTYNTSKTNTLNPIIDLTLDTLYINNQLVDINRIRDNLYLGLIKKTEDLLFNSLLLYKENSIDSSTYSGPIIDLDSLQDDLSFITPDKGIHDNPSFLIYKDIILNLIYTRGSNFNKLFYPDNPLNPSEYKFNLSSVRLYLKIRNKFIRNLALLTYLLSGSPIRGQEVLIIRPFNTLYPRNIYIDISTKLVIINTAYDKTGDKLKLARENLRFLPTPLSRLYLYYLTLVFPFYRYLKLEYLELEKDSEYLFEINNELIESSTLSNLLKKEASNSLNIRKLGLSPWRDLILYIINTRIHVDKSSLKGPTLISKGYNKNYVTPIQDILANHSKNTAELHYSRSNILFSTTTSSIFNRSKEFASLYFSYFNLIEIRDISTIIKERNIINPILGPKDTKIIANTKKSPRKLNRDNTSSSDNISSIERNLGKTTIKNTKLRKGSKIPKAYYTSSSSNNNSSSSEDYIKRIKSIEERTINPRSRRTTTSNISIVESDSDNIIYLDTREKNNLRNLEKYKKKLASKSNTKKTTTNLNNNSLSKESEDIEREDIEEEELEIIEGSSSNPISNLSYKDKEIFNRYSTLEDLESSSSSSSPIKKTNIYSSSPITIRARYIEEPRISTPKRDRAITLTISPRSTKRTKEIDNKEEEKEEEEPNYFRLIKDKGL